MTTQTEAAIPVRRALAKALAEAGTLQALSDRIGVSIGYICDVRSGLRPPGPKICRALGFERRVEYVKATNR